MTHIVAAALLMLLLSHSARADDTAAHTLHLPTVASSSRCLPVTPSAFGVEMYGDTGPSSPYYEFLLESGATWVRAPISWSQIEPINVAPSEYQWAHADRVVGAASAACLHMVVTHANDPEWAAMDVDAPLDATGMAELAEYLGALVERYDGDGLEDAPGSPIVRHWEIYNEPDDIIPLYGGRWGHAGAAYAQMLSIVYPAIKAADPQAQVLLGGIAHDWNKGQPSPFSFGFLDDVLKAGGGAYFDIMNFHTYPPYAENWAKQGPGLYEKTEYMRAKLARYGLEKPIFITETAHHSNDAWPGIGGSHEMQMRFVVQLYAQALAANVEMMVWFALSDPGGNYPFNSGLVTRGPPAQAKPAFAVYQNAAAHLGHARFVRRLTLAEMGVAAMEAYEFIDDQRHVRIIVAWLDPVQTEERATLSLPAQQAAVYNMQGESATIYDTDDGNEDGQIEVQVTGQPLYVVTDLP